MKRMFTRISRGQRGITGIETAIILIAFVIVASVFAYVVLSAGLFSTQKAKEAINAGLNEAKSTIETQRQRLRAHGEQHPHGDLLYRRHDNRRRLDRLHRPDSSNGSNPVVISYADSYQLFPSMNWTMTKLNTNNADNILDQNELFMITVDLGCVSDNATPEEMPGPYHRFELEIKPPSGAVLILERTIPARANQVVNLY